MTRMLDIATANGSWAKRWSNKRVTWGEFLAMQREPRRTAETMAEYASASKSERDRAKNGPAFVGGYLEGGRRLKGSVRHRSMLVLDADNADADIEADWDMLVGAAACSWPTHSSSDRQRKVRVAAPLSRDCSPEEYVPLALKVMERLGLGRFDPTTVEPERLMYCSSVSSDAPFELWECEGPLLDVDEWLGYYADWRDASCWPMAVKGVGEKAGKAGDPREKPGAIGAFCRAYTIDAAVAEFLSDVYEPAKAEGRYTFLGGSSYGGMRVYDGLWAWSDHATDPANTGHLCNAWDLVRLHRFGHLDDGSREDAPQGQLPSSREMTEWAASLGPVSEEMARASLAGAAEDFAAAGDDSWIGGLETNARTGAIVPSANNFRLIMENDPDLRGRVRLDVRTGAPVVVGGDLPWREVPRDGDNWMDVDDAGLRVLIEERYRIEGRQKIFDAVGLAAQAAPYDPVREYLDGLPEWDGVERADSLLVDMLGAEDCAYTRAVTRKLLCAAVRRAKQPGCKFDYTVILEGPQGIGKSTLLADLGGEWFTDGVSINDMAHPKTAAEKLQCNWIVEIAELDGMQKTSIEALKAFITTREDNYRAAYAKRAEKHPRRCVMVGTVNNVNGYLRDASGNRRFWPVPVSKRYAMGALEPWVRDQVWAEAVLLEPRERLFLPASLEAYAEARQREAMEADPREGLILEYIERAVPADLDSMTMEERELFFERAPETVDGADLVERDSVCVAEIWHEALGGATTKATRNDAYAITGMLRRLGWVPDPSTARTRAYGVVKKFRKGAV